MADSRIILGVDPGTTIMGFGIIKVEGKKISCLQLNELKLSQYESHYMRLGHIYTRTSELIETYKPDEMALEAPFFGKNVQSMLKLGRAQGVAIAVNVCIVTCMNPGSLLRISQAIDFLCWQLLTSLQILPDSSRPNRNLLDLQLHHL